jgi:histidinol-phosphatase (PHP family)
MSEYERTFDYHVHERHSTDAAATSIRDIVKTAESKGLSEIAFTTHLVTGGPDAGFGIQPNQIPEYMEEIYAAQEETDVTLRTGLEVDYFPEEERHIEQVLGEHPFDFILGSVHRVNGLNVAEKDGSLKFFSGRPLSESIQEYLGVWNKAVESGLFDVMAHPDYFKKYLPQMGYPQLKFRDFGPTIYESFDRLASYGIGFEINTSCIRHGAGSFFPVADFVREARIAGVKKVTVGSDTHVANTLGFNISEALSLMKESGYDQVSVFRGRRRSSVSLSDLRRRETATSDLVIPPLVV